MDEDLERLNTEVTMALAGLDVRATQCGPKERAGKWSIQEIAEHLLLAIEGSSTAIRERLEKGSATKSRPSLGQRVGQWLILNLRWFPTGRKAPEAAAPKRPVTLKTGDQLADRVHGALVELDKVGGRAKRSFGEGPVASHPSLGALTVAQWNRFHLVHGEHHLKQIARIRREWGF